MVGSYHQFGAFVSGVASLPRVVILTMHDISLQAQGRQGRSPATVRWSLSGTVKTYRYLDDRKSRSRRRPRQPRQPSQAQPPAPAAARGGWSMSMQHARSPVPPAWLVAACLVLSLSACGRGITSTPGDAPNLEKWIADVRARPAPPLEPLPVMQQFETFEYAAQSLRDPFSDAWSNSGRRRSSPRSGSAQANA